MAYTNPRLGFHHPQGDSKQITYFEETESEVLDPAILDADIMQSPNSAQFRKDSFANTAGVISPADSQGWDRQFNGGLNVENGHSAPTSFHDESNGFVRPSAPRVHPHPQPFPQAPHGAPWTLDQSVGNGPPATTGVEYLPPHPQYAVAPHPMQRTQSAHASIPTPMVPPPQPYQTTNVEPGFIPAPQVQTPMSPHSHQDWMEMAHQQQMEGRQLSKRMRPSSPTMDYAHRDGIRKKNNRIDIPTERNIHTIDDLIDKTTDEELLKELKQQKRLLRNREAAYVPSNRFKVSLLVDTL
jgi:hypothetical protein